MVRNIECEKDKSKEFLFPHFRLPQSDFFF